MFDELERLRTNPSLFALLTHYATVGTPDRDAWQDRLPSLGDVRGQDLVRLYGELLAFGWIEQNTGVVPVFQPGTVAQCYRITSLGRRALRRASAGRAGGDEDAEAA